MPIYGPVTVLYLLYSKKRKLCPNMDPVYEYDLERAERTDGESHRAHIFNTAHALANPLATSR